MFNSFDSNYNICPRSDQKESWEVDVPHDDSYLFWAAALSYLIPAGEDNHSFQTRFEKQFGAKESGFVKDIKDSTSQYNLFNNLKKFINIEVNRLIREKFRKLLTECIAEDEAAIKS